MKAARESVVAEGKHFVSSALSFIRDSNIYRVAYDRSV
jgi:hypothetical protein